MNRLWVRISLVIVAVALFIGLLPFALRTINPPTRPLPRPDIGEPISAERLEAIQRVSERQVWEAVARTLIVGAVLGVGGGILLSRWLSKPLTELEQGTRAIGEHELGTRIPEKGSSEMRAVASSFNQMAADLEREEALRRNMLADVTHELRHPVHVLQGNLQGVLDGVFPLSLAEIAILSEQAHHLTRLVDDLHELALAEAHELPLNRQLIDLRQVVRDSAETVNPLAVQEGIVLVMQVPDEAVMFSTDMARLRQAVQNLLGNALRHTPTNGTVQLSLRTDGNRPIISVADSGSGIAPKDLPYIFDRFYRSDASRDRGSGSAGLGLAIVKAIVEAHGGTVTVANAASGQGAKFVISLP
ncbi:MAG: ATP-binding protein [Anaerolineae bacterium]|nr:ATP-binding protein [Anaerolineae bacterium]